MDDLFTSFTRSYDARRAADMSLADYLQGCRSDPMMYASAPERILAAIGAPEMVDTAKDSRPRAWRNASRSFTCWVRSAAGSPRSPSA